jgi:hypothetical protein
LRASSNNGRADLAREPRARSSATSSDYCFDSQVKAATHDSTQSRTMGMSTR